MDLPVPHGLEYLHYQESGIRSALKYLESHLAFGFNDEMGLGKTVQAIGVANALQADTMLICCPSHLCEQWRDEILKWSDSVYPIQIVRVKKDEPRPDHHLIISFGALSAKYNKRIDEMTYYPKLPKFDIGVIDEVHGCKGRATRRTRSVLPRILAASDRILTLSGTFPVSSAIDLWPVLKKLFPQQAEGYTYSDFGYKFCRAQYYTERKGNQPGKKIVKFVGVENEDELNDILYGSGAFIRREISDVRKDLPKPIMKLIPWSGDEYTKFLTAERPFKKKLMEQDAAMMKRVPPEKIATLRREFSLAKVPRIANLTRALASQGKVFVLMHHRESIDALVEALSDFRCSKIYGGISPKNRATQIDQFIMYEHQIMVGNIQSCNSGLNMQSCHQIVFGDTDWLWEENRQAIARCRRHGQVRQVHVYFPVVKGSLDSRLIVSALEKHSDVAKLKGGTA